MDDLLNNINKKNHYLNISGIFDIAFYAISFSLGFSAIVSSDSSIVTNSNLEARIEYLKQQIDFLNKENAKLQKDYFELLSIQGDYAN